MNKELHIEASSNCQAKCAMCPRTGREDLVINSLSLKWFDDNIDAATLDKIMFCGNLGDPCANKELLHICEHLKSQNPDIVLGINTNGGLRSVAWWQTLAETLTGERDYVVFSIDGTAKTNHIYREKVSRNKLEENAKAFIDAGGNAHWDMLVFQHNFHEVEECKRIAKEMGFTWFRVKETSRWDVYPPGTAGLHPVNMDWKEPIQIEINCEANRDCSRYIDAQGREWPCCHIAEEHFFNSNADIKSFTNVELLNNYNERLQTDPYGICKKACGTTSRTSQWKQEIEFNE